MEHRIRAAAIVVSDGRLLLVKHRHPRTGVEWWVPPGGGLEGDESVFDCAVREAYEETGLTVSLGEILYLSEFVDLELGRHNLEVFIQANTFMGRLTTRHLRPNDSDALYVREARFLSAGEMDGLTVFPEILKDELWHDLARVSQKVRYLGLKREANTPWAATPGP